MISNHKKKVNKPNSLLIMFLICISLIYGSFSISSGTLYPVSSNMGERTDYYLQYTSELTSSLSDINLKLSVPIEYDLSQIENNLGCYYSTVSADGPYLKLNSDKCYTQPNTQSSYSTTGNIIIKLNNYKSFVPVHVVLRNILNPNKDSTSFFELCLRSSIHNLQCHKQFKMMTFTPIYNTNNIGLSIKHQPEVTYVGQGSTFYFKMNSNIVALTPNYDIDMEYVKIKVVFPVDFILSKPICSLMQYNQPTGVYSSIQSETKLSPSRSNSIECTKITHIKSKYLYNSELYLKIQNIQNPKFSQDFSGFYIQIIRGARNQTIQKITFPQIIKINPQLIDGAVVQQNLMRNSTNLYYFYLTHDLDYRQNSQIRLSIGNNSTWKVNSIKSLYGFSNITNVRTSISNQINQSIVLLSNYGVASLKDQQIIVLNVTSTSLPGNHMVKIQTFTDNKISGIWQGTVKVNQTWGAFNMLSFSAVERAIKLPVGQTGPLQFTLFLNYQLPASQNVQNGSMHLSITPKLPTPDPDIYGVVKCYFKQVFQSANCTFDNDSDHHKTLIKIVSPPYDVFQYSQIPIVLTTEGGIDDSHLGFTIKDIVQRYKFQAQFYLYNSSVVPSQVLYTTWIADAIELTSLTGYSLTHECGQKTSLHFNFKTPIMSQPNQRLMFQFLPDINNMNAWASGLGYQTEKVYKQYPCVIVGLIGERIKCDLWTYVKQIGPYNHLHINDKYFGSYITVYGFEQPSELNTQIDVYLPGIKLSDTIGADAVVSFSILSETPGQIQPYLQLYHQNITVFKTIKNTIQIKSNINSQMMGDIPVQTLTGYSMNFTPSVNLSSVKYIRYDFTHQIPSLLSEFLTCNSAISQCYSSGYPNNWLVQILSTPLSTQHQLNSTLNIITMNYVKQLKDFYEVIITTYDSLGNTLQQIYLNHTYVPQIMTGTFSLIDPNGVMYSGLKQWYNVGFFTNIATTSAYPFLRFKLSQEMVFALPEQCSSTTVLPYNATGIRCTIVNNTNNQQLLVWNIQQLLSSTSYDLNVRLQTSASSHIDPIQPTIDVYENHNYSVIDSLSAEVRGVILPSQIPKLGKPKQFKISNPQILNDQIRVNYIGRLFFQFQSSTDITTDFKITLKNHRYNLGIWKTPNYLDLDPMVCMINHKRFYCNPTNGALQLQIYIKSAQILTGTNRIQLDSEYLAPYNGIYFPAYAGNYQIQLSSIDPITLTQSISHTFFIYIHPYQLQDIEIASIVRDIDTESVYVVNFTIADLIHIPTPNHDQMNYSRIFIEFPTMANGIRVFEDNLGGYQGKINQRVGCAFKYLLPNVGFEINKTLQCRLIPPPIPGAPVTVEIINYNIFDAATDSMAVYIFKVFNPSIAHNSVQIKVKINQYFNENGYIYPLFQSDCIVFLDPAAKNQAPQNFPHEDQVLSLFDTTYDVGDYGSISLKAHTINSTAVFPYYMIIKLPDYLPVQNDQLSPAFLSCSPATFEYCFTVSDINYVFVKAIANLSTIQVYIKNYPISISQDDSFFYSMVIQSGRYVGNLQYNINDEQRWKDIQGEIAAVSIYGVGLLQKTVMLKQKFHVAVSFTTTNYIPSSGSIQISFPQSIIKIYPYCRSSVANGSLLTSQSGVISGQIGCQVQNGNKWVITGFNSLQNMSLVIIDGYIDLPNNYGDLGNGQVITYSDTHSNDIYSNGSRIDYFFGKFNLIVTNSLAMNPNQNVFMTQRDVIRANDIGQFRLLITFAEVVTNTTGSIMLDFNKNTVFDQLNVGFSLSPGIKKVCQLIDMTNQDRIGCEVTNQLTNATSVRLIMRFFDNLLVNNPYELRLTTQKYSQPQQRQGIIYPSKPGMYKIQVHTKYSSATTTPSVQHLYLQVMGTSFKNLKITQHNYVQDQWNLYWIELQPTTSIQIDHQIVVQFPTRSNDDLTQLFTNNLGLDQYQNGDIVAFDIFSSLVDGLNRNNTFMKCRIFFGDYTNGIPVKIICGQFQYQIDQGQTLRFALKVKNPAIIFKQISIPLVVYSFDPALFSKTNFNLVNGVGYIYNLPNILVTASKSNTTSFQYQFQGDDFLIGDAHTNPLQIGDAFVIMFNFPLRVNDFKLGGCKMTDNTTIFGDAYYHQRLRMVVCKVTTTIVPGNISPAGISMMINGFYTPWYYLSLDQRSLYAIAHYYSTTTSQIIKYTDKFPQLKPRYQFTPTFSSKITMTPILLHNTLCQRDDYIFSIQLDINDPVYKNIQYTRLIGITFPLFATADYMMFSGDCVEHQSSTIEVRLCEVDQVTRTIYIEIYPDKQLFDNYTNNRLIAIRTKNLAIRNPCILTPVIPYDMNQFVVNFYSWQNITTSDRRSSNRVYMTMDTRNIISTPLTFINQVSNGSTSFFYAMDWVHIPNQRYFAEFPQYITTGQYSPFKFDIRLAAGQLVQAIPQATGNYHKLTLTYGKNFDIPGSKDWVDDLQYNKQLCYLRNNRVQRCFNDLINGKITMQFEFQLPIDTLINLYFSVQDPRDMELNGFRYNGSDSDISSQIYLELQQYNTTSTDKLYFKPLPFEGKQTQQDTANKLPQRSIINGQVDWATSIVSQLNVIDMTFTINTTVTQIKGLKFEIPLVDQYGDPIFSNPTVAFMDLNDGDQYPCGNNDPGNPFSMRAKCYLFHGDNTVLGMPAVITMTDFNYTHNSIIKARIMLKNPADAGQWVSVMVKAYKGQDGSSNSTIGHKYVGYWKFPNIYKTVAPTVLSSGTYTSTIAYIDPSNILWKNLTTWTISGDSPYGIVAVTSQYVIMQAYLNDYDGGWNEPQLCQVDWSIGNQNTDDMIKYKPRQYKQQKVFFIKKWNGAWSLNYFKCKHYRAPIKVYYNNAKDTLYNPIYNVDAGLDYYWNIASTINYIQMLSIRSYIQIDITDAINHAITNGLRWEDQVDYYMKVNIVLSILSFSTITDCQAVGGFKNNQGAYVNCQPLSSMSFQISKFNQLVPDSNGKYYIKIDIRHTNLTSISPTNVQIDTIIYAGLDAYIGNVYMFYSRSNIYTLRYMVNYQSGLQILGNCNLYPTCLGGNSTRCGLYPISMGYRRLISLPHTWPNNVVGYAHYQTTHNLVATFTKFSMSTISLSLQVKVTPVVGYNVQVDYTHTLQHMGAFAFRFYLQGIQFNPTSIPRFTAYYGSPLNAVDLKPGMLKFERNYIQFYSYTKDMAQSTFRTFNQYFPGMGPTFVAGRQLTFNIQMTGSSVDNLVNRDWVGLRVFMNTVYFEKYANGSHVWCNQYCTSTDPVTLVVTTYCCDVRQQWFPMYSINNYFTSYGQAFYQRSELFDVVQVSALSKHIGVPTQLQISMHHANTAFGSADNKVLLIQFLTSSTVLFPYVTNIGVKRVHPIQCFCQISPSATFTGPTPHNDLDCKLRLTQAPIIRTSIYVNIPVALNQYVRCFFPGFVADTSSLIVQAKLVNKGSHIPNQPQNTQSIQSIYRKLSSPCSFITPSIPTGTVTQSPAILDGTRNVSILTGYTSPGYSLTFSFPTQLENPIFYVDFQKGGPIPDNNLCSNTAVFKSCRVYSKYRKIMVAQLKTNSSTVTFTSTSVKLPIVVQPQIAALNDYNLLIYAKSDFVSNQYYNYQGAIIRHSTGLLPLNPGLTIQSDKLTGSKLNSYTTNLIISFTLSGGALDSFYKDNARMQITYNDTIIITPNKGCTVTTFAKADDQMFQFYCQIFSANKTINIFNRYYDRLPFSVTGAIQVVIGVINPPTFVKFDMKLYKWYISPTDYGLITDTSGIYQPFALDATQLLQSRNQIKMYPFFTRVDTDVFAPFRMGFKLPQNMSASLTYTLNTTNYLIFDAYQTISNFGIFECLIKQFSDQPLTNIQTFQPNAFRNYQQNLQYYHLPTYCNKSGTFLTIQIPRNRDLTIGKYYQLIILPVNSTTTGFLNADDTLMKLLAFPNPRAGHIFNIKQWKQDVFSLQKINLVTSRTQQPTAMRIIFKTTFSSALTYPEHYIEIIFRNLDMTAILPAYNAIGQTIPCTLSSLFTNSTKGNYSANCVLSSFDKLHGIIKIRVQNLGTLAIGQYKLTFDYFFLPALVNMLQKSNTFTMCLHFFSVAIVHEKCFNQLFVIDGWYVNMIPRNNLTNVSTFTHADDLSYGTPLKAATISHLNPKTTSLKRDQKVMIQMKGGYTATTQAITFTYPQSERLWYNPMINLYIYKLGTLSDTVNHTITMGNLTNPQPYQKQQYSDLNQIIFTYFQGFHPNTRYIVLPTPYSMFTKNPPKVLFSASIPTEDIQTNIKAGTDGIIKFVMDITQDYPKLRLHENDELQIVFTSNLAKVKKCWIRSGILQYSRNTQCTPKPNQPTKISILNFYQSNTDKSLKLHIFIQAQLTGTPVTMDSYLFSRNNQLQYQHKNKSAPITTLQTTQMTGYTTLSFSQNHYIPDYFQQIIRPVTYESRVSYLYLSFFLPEDLLEYISKFTIYLNSTLTIKPRNITMLNTRLICEWMKVDTHGRKYDTGIFSICNYVQPNIVVNAPLGGLLAYHNVTNERIPYLLKIRQQYIIQSQFIFPQTSQVQQIKLSLDNNGNYKQDTLYIHPHDHFKLSKSSHYTLTVDQLNTFHIQFGIPKFIPLGPGPEYILTLQFDNKYMYDTFMIQQIYELYGCNPKNQSIVDNNKHNLIIKSLPNKWINGIPYTSYTSLDLTPENTHIQTSDKTIKVNLLISSAEGGLVWKIPLLKNPALIRPYRMNLTLWSYPVGSLHGNKQLFYQIINQHKTKPIPTQSSIPYKIQSTVSLSNRIQSQINSLSIQFLSYLPTQNDIIQLKLLPHVVSMIDIPSFVQNSFVNKMIPDTSYQFYYFENLNMLIAHKLVTDNSNIIKLGNIEWSNQYADYYGYEWMKVHSKNGIETIKKNTNPVKQLVPACNITTVRFTLLSGTNLVQQSQFQGKFTMTTPCRIHSNSTIKLFSSTNSVQFLQYNTQTYCQTNFRSMGCWADNGKLYVRIDDEFIENDVLQISTFVKSKQLRSIQHTIQGTIYAIPELQYTLINNILPTAILPITTPSSLSNGHSLQLIIKPLYQNIVTQIHGTFIPDILSFTNLTFSHPFTKLITSNQSFYYQINTTGCQYNQGMNEDTYNLQWIKPKSVPLSETQTIQYIQLDNGINLNTYNIQRDVQYMFTISSMYEQTADLNNFTVGPVGKYYQFQYLTQSQISYHQVYPLPISQPITIINPLTHIGQKTVLGIQFNSSKQDIFIGDRIQIQLDAYNLIQNMYEFTSDPIQCIEYTKGILTANPQLVCEVTQYPDAINNIPLKIIVYPEITVVKGNPVKIWISPVINSLNVLVAGVTVKLLRDCQGEQYCIMYQGRGYYRTTNVTQITQYGLGVATFLPTPMTVLQPLATHDYTFNTIQMNAAFIEYPQNYKTIMPLTCTATGGDCLIFPRQRKVVTITPAIITSSLSVMGLTNGIYLLPEQNIHLKIASISQLDKYQVYHDYLQTQQKILLLNSIPTTFTITNTQNSRNWFLRNYWNTARLQIKGLFTDRFIKTFYIVAPYEDVTQWDKQYCNATISSLNHNPYPTRLECTYVNDTIIQIIIPEGVYYVANVSQLQLLTIHARFWLQDFPPNMDILYVSPSILSKNWHAYGSFNSSNSTRPYYITQAITNITISQHKVPYIGMANFNTESYIERLASTNQLCSFDILMDPITTQPIDYIQIIIPEQFEYPNVLYHDLCKMIYVRTSQLDDCRQIRKDNQTIVRINIDQSKYMNNPILLQINSFNQTNLFTAPDLPGILYNMTISLYGINDKLLQKQITKNSSRIKGQTINIPSIIIDNDRDMLQSQIVDIEFNTTSNGIKQGYQGILTKANYYSEIIIMFETVKGFEDLLGDTYMHLSKVGCITNLKAINRQISCVLDAGTNINDQPKIIITGYQQIPADFKVRISLANIKNLNSTTRNSLSISVKYYKVGDVSLNKQYSFFMIQPTQKMFKSTSPLVYKAPTTLSITYTGQMVVNQPTTLMITVTPSVNITDYFVIKFPKNGLRDQYSRFNVTCGNCSKVQIFYRAQVIRIYPVNSIHLVGVSMIYKLQGFPSTQYILRNLQYPLIFQGYSSSKIVNYQKLLIPVIMNGCKMNSGIISITSPYSGDTEVNYSFQILVNVSQLNIREDEKQVNVAINLPINSEWFSVNSECKVDYPLRCSIQKMRKRVVVKNIHLLTKNSIKLNITKITNPSVNIKTTLNYSSILYEQNIQTQLTSTQYGQQKRICEGYFNFQFLPSPPNKCDLSINSQHYSTVKQNQYGFKISCEQALRNNTQILIKLPRQTIFNNPLTSSYKCWTSDPSLLLQSSCSIISINSSYYLKTSSLTISLNVLQVQLNVILSNPLLSNMYNYSILLSHSNNVFAVTNVIGLMFKNSPIVNNLNTSMSMVIVPKQAGADAVYMVKVPTSSVRNKLVLNFGQLGLQFNSETKVSYYQTSDSNFSSSQSYFDIIQKTYLNSLPYENSRLYDFSQTLNIDTTQSMLSSTNNNISSYPQWTYILISPVTNPSSSSSTDQLQIKTFDTIKKQQSSYQILRSQTSILMNLTIQKSPYNIYYTKYQVSDKDILQLNSHKITYMLDYQLFINNDNIGINNENNDMIDFIINPPSVNINLLDNVEICMYKNNITLNNIVQCKLAQIGQELLSFKLSVSNITIKPDQPFIFDIRNLTNPKNQTLCQQNLAKQFDYLQSYFGLKIFMGQSLKYQTLPLLAYGAPCVQFTSRKADILCNIPLLLSSGFQQHFNISITQPTKYLRVKITTNDTDLVIQPNILYFNSYSIMSQEIKAIASPYGVRKNVLITIEHEESGGMDLFRYTTPFSVKIVQGKLQTIILEQVQSSSVGYDIVVPITLSRSSISNMTLKLSVPSSTNLSLFQFSSYQIFLPAFTLKSNFTFKYLGNTLPSTLNITLKLISQNIITHYLLKEKVYFYFSIDLKYQTLPSVMKMQLLYEYKQNKNQMNKVVYYCCNKDNEIMTKYDYLKPVIIKNDILQITSRSANVQVTTRNQAILYYQVKQKGDHLALLNITSQQLRLQKGTLSAQTKRNSTKIINPIQTLNLTSLDYQTEYYLFISAFDAFGDSQNISIVSFKTKALPTAIKFNLNCIKIQTDQVKIVRILADILQIDMTRIKVVSSEKNLEKMYNSTKLNQPIYPHQIVISPSTGGEDSMSPEDLFKEMLLNHQKNQKILKQLIPSWTGMFDSKFKYQQKPFYEINRIRPGFSHPPQASRISYYNASISVKFWNQARIYAILLIQQNSTPSNTLSFINTKPIGKKLSTLSSQQRNYTPNSKQIIKGLNQYNQKLDNKFTYNGLTNVNGEGSVFFRGLKPGSKCKVYITGTNVEIFEPYRAVQDNQIYLLEFNLMWNPNLKGNQNTVLNQLKSQNPQMYQVIRQYNENQDTNKKTAVRKG